MPPRQTVVVSVKQEEGVDLTTRHGLEEKLLLLLLLQEQLKEEGLLRHAATAPEDQSGSGREVTLAQSANRSLQVAAAAPAVERPDGATCDAKPAPLFVN